MHSGAELTTHALPCTLCTASGTGVGAGNEHMETARVQAPTLTLGERLRAARDHAGLTTRDAAYAIDASASGVAKWERDGADPGASKIAKLAKLYNVDVRWLLEGVDTSAVSGPNQGHPLVVIEGGKTSGPRPRPPVCPVERAA